MVTDSNTKELTLAIASIKLGKTPYVIINNLKRTKFDANRDSIEGAQGNIYARRAWEEFHYYINESKNDSTIFNYGLFLIYMVTNNPDVLVI